jgi:hypothetical protein
MTSPNELTYFTVIGNWWDVESPDPSGTTNQPQFLPVSGFVSFAPRLRPGTVCYIPNLDLGAGTAGNTAVPLAPITGRILEGQLQTINRSDTQNLKLVANTPILGLTQPLLYDVSFSNVVYANNAQLLLPFAFTAPTTATTVDICNPTLSRLKYDPTNYTN